MTHSEQEDTGDERLYTLSHVGLQCPVGLSLVVDQLGQSNRQHAPVEDDTLCGLFQEAALTVALLVQCLFNVHRYSTRENNITKSNGMPLTGDKSTIVASMQVTLPIPN